MRKSIFISVLVLTSILLTACGSAAAPTEASSAKSVNIVLSTNPNPAAVGDVEIVFTITDADGKPIEGAKVDVSAEHPAMAGMGMSGAAVEQSGGVYSIKANFSDPGTWKITIYVRKDGLDYKEEIELEIQ
ncbi:MAG: FixH family protein [Chloroflexi bacterium]|nr:FixH family protein [Chloroflexota bacterium]